MTAVHVERGQHLVPAEDAQTIIVHILFGGRAFRLRRKNKVHDFVAVHVEIGLRDRVELGRQLGVHVSFVDCACRIA